MNKFLVKVVSGKLVPVQPSKNILFEKILKESEALNKKFYITIEEVNKDVNESQLGLYRAFIVRASDHFGNTYKEMEHLTNTFKPMDTETGEPTNVERWSSEDLNNFLIKASHFLSDYGFKF